MMHFGDEKIIHTIENAKWPKGAVEDSFRSLETISANCDNATTATSHRQLHGGMNRV